jgi:hypothetical protein
MPPPDGLADIDEWLASVRLSPQMDVAEFATAARQLDGPPGDVGSASVDGYLVHRYREGDLAQKEVALAALRARGVGLYRLTDGRTVVSNRGSTERPVRSSISEVTYAQLVSPVEVRDDVDRRKAGPVSRWLTRRLNSSIP